MITMLISGRLQRVLSWLSLLTLVSMLVAASSVIVSSQEELRGNLALAMIVLSLLANIATLFSYGANR
jgi:hypothetical protein